MQKRFRILRFVGTIYKILAWIVLAGGVLFAIAALVAPLLGLNLMRWVPPRYRDVVPVGSVVAGIVSFVIGLLTTFLYFVALYAVGEGIYLFLAIEENTRETTLLLRAQAGGRSQVVVQSGYTPPPVPPPPPPEPLAPPG
jgi:hypothetical protein